MITSKGNVDATDQILTFQMSSWQEIQPAEN